MQFIVDYSQHTRATALANHIAGEQPFQNMRPGIEPQTFRTDSDVLNKVINVKNLLKMTVLKSDGT